MDADCRATVDHKSVKQATDFFSLNHTVPRRREMRLKWMLKLKKSAFEEAAKQWESFCVLPPFKSQFIVFKQILVKTLFSEKKKVRSKKKKMSVENIHPIAIFLTKNANVVDRSKQQQKKKVNKERVGRALY